jgi:hypothetical protein
VTADFQSSVAIPVLLFLVTIVLMFEAFELSTRTTSMASIDASDLHRKVEALQTQLSSFAAANPNAVGGAAAGGGVHGGGVPGAAPQAALSAPLSRALPTSAKRSGRHEAGIAADLGYSGRRLHFVFSGDCRYPPKVHWQSVALLYSFFATQPYPAVITEVLSCHDMAWKPHWHDYFTPQEQARVRFHVAPARNPHPKTGDEYAPYNKPSGLRHWVTQTGGPFDNDLVVMVDWDNILVRQFSPELLTAVQDRKPQAALYGIGTTWATNDIAKSICPDWCPKKSSAEVEAVGAAGSPHVWTARDFRDVLPLWQDYTERIRADARAREAGGWMAEMYGYLLGALQLGFAHKINAEWMLSSSHPYEWNNEMQPPLVLHYCQQYHVGDWHFYKYDLSAHDALACDFPLLEEPPENVGVGTEFPQANTKDLWIAHSLVMHINRAFTWYKQRACGHSWRSNGRWKPKPDSIGEMAGAPGGTWMRRGP